MSKFSRGTLARAWTWSWTCQQQQRFYPTPCLPPFPHSRPFSTNPPLALTSSPLRQTTSNLQSRSGDAALLPEFDLSSHIILVSGAARGLGLTMASALLEAGATVYALDRLPSPTPPFDALQSRFSSPSRLHYRQIDVRNVPQLNRIVEEIGDKEGRMDGLIAAAGIQQETSALEYTKEDANRMFEVNVTGVLMTSQAVAKQMIRYGNGGSVALIASMSGTVANRVPRPPSLSPPPFPVPHVYILCLLLPSHQTKIIINNIQKNKLGPHMPGLQRLQSCCRPTRS